MAKLLSNLRLKWLSLVDSPANQHSEVKLAKRLEKAIPTTRTAGSGAGLNVTVTIPEGADAATIAKLTGGAVDSWLAKVGKGQPDVGDVHIPTAGKILHAAAAVSKLARFIAKARLLPPAAFAAVVKDAVTFGDLIDNQETQELVNALCATLWSICDDDDSTPDDKTGLITQALKDFYTALTAPDAGDAEPLTKTEIDMTPEELTTHIDAAIAKAIPLAVSPLRADLEKAVAEKTELEKRLAAQDATILTLTKAEGRRALVAKVAGVVAESDAPVETATVADIIDDLPVAKQDAILALVKQLGALAADGQIFKTFASGGEAPESSPLAVIEKLALAKQAADPKLGIEKARSLVMAEHPELYEDATTVEE